jgi:hypothetical protein
MGMTNKQAKLNLPTSNKFLIGTVLMPHNDGGMVSWGLDTDNLSAQYKLNKYNE